MFITAQVLQKLLRGDEISGTETLREAIVDGLEAGGGVIWAALITQQPGEAGGRA